MFKLSRDYADVRMFILLKRERSLNRGEVPDSTINFRDHWVEAKPSERKTQKSL